jgi:hypothetical protein
MRAFSLTSTRPTHSVTNGTEDADMATLRIENFRNGQWMMRGQGPIPADTSLNVIKANTDRSALNGPTRALLDGVVVYGTNKLTKAQAKAVFGF